MGLDCIAGNWQQGVLLALPGWLGARAPQVRPCEGTSWTGGRGEKRWTGPYMQAKGSAHAFEKGGVLRRVVHIC